jgi:N-acetylglucosaminyldiphosphoundecaprenol N-acetyl-beta-D-mannosaminyltransferase
MKNKMIDTKNLYRGLSFYKGTIDNFVADVFRYSKADLDLPNLVVTPNPEMIVEMSRNAKFEDVLKSADYKLVDGFGLWFALKYLWGEKHLYRICGSDLLEVMLNTNAKMEDSQKLNIYLLGAMPGVAATIAKMYPKANIVGVDAPDFSLDEADGEIVCQKIVNAETELLFVAFGAPKQELWMSKFKSKLTGVKFVLGVGGAFDYVSEEVSRAPVIMRKFVGFEWLYRLCREPLKRWKRIYRALIVFPFVFMKDFLNR